MNHAVSLNSLGIKFAGDIINRTCRMIERLKNFKHRIGRAIRSRPDESAPLALEQTALAFNQTALALCRLERELVSARWETLRRDLLRNPPYNDDRCLLGSGVKIYSQFDQDGIIREIFNRIGCENRFFVEFGCGCGLESNTLCLLLSAWRGAWMDADAALIATIQRELSAKLTAGQLALKQAFVTAKNIEPLLAELHVPAEPDLLSIDIDYNGYGIWKVIESFRPRVVVVEYNASFGPSVDCKAKYAPDVAWDSQTRTFGASLKAFERLGKEKGYSLVGTNFTGVDAFFVRDDLAGDKFLPPYTSETHYQPPRYNLQQYTGFATDWKEATQLDFAPFDPGRK